MHTLKISLLVFLLSITISAQDFWLPTNCPNYRVQKVLIINNGYIFAGTWDAGVYRSTDNGENWTHSNNGMEMEVIETILSNDEGYIYVGGYIYGRIYRSSDNGEHWVEKSDGIPITTSVWSLGEAPNGDLIAGTYGSGYFRSTNNGDNWIYFGDPGNVIMDFLVLSDSVLYAAGSFGVYKSYDNGVTWTSISPYPSAFAILANSYSHLFVGHWMYPYSVTRSIDNGVNWDVCPLPFDQTRSFAINSSDEIFAGTWGDGVYRSSTNGESWTKINDGLTNFNVHSLAVDSSGYLYAGTDGGLFRSVQPITSINEKNIERPSSIGLSQNYPNPFNPVTKIKYSIPQIVRRETGNVSLKIYDVLGREVATLINEEKPAGEYEVEFNGSNFPSGIYFYQLLVSALQSKDGKAGSFVETRKMVLLK